MEKEKKKQIILHVTEDQHTKIKSLAASRGVSMKYLVLWLIDNELKQEVR